MNIIIDTELYENLLKRSVFTLEVGSVLYNLQTKYSDQDIYSIYLCNERELASLIGNNHYQLQYRTDNQDWLFTSLQGFFRNVLTGGSTICFEMMHHPEFQREFNVNVKDFYNYNILKAYLGLVKRDLERLQKVTTLYDKRKILAHAYRGYIFAKEILEGRTLRLKIDEYDETIQSNFNILRNFEKEWTEADDDICDFIYGKAMDMRMTINEELQAGTLQRYMDPIKQRDLDKQIFDYQKSKTLDLSTDLDLQVIYDLLEHNVK